MGKLASIAAFIALVGLLPWSAAAQDASDAGDPQAGRAIALKVCSSCHIVSSDQRRAVPPGAPDFHAIANRPGVTARSLYDSLVMAHTGMPYLPVDYDGTRNVIGYIMSLRDRH